MTEKDPAAIDIDALIRESEKLLPPYHPPGALEPIPFDEIMSYRTALQQGLLQDAASPPFGNLGGRPRQYTRDDLLAEFDRVRHAIGKDPTWADIDRHARIGRATYQSRIGNMPQLREAHQEWAAARPPACTPAPAARPAHEPQPGPVLLQTVGANLIAMKTSGGPACKAGSRSDERPLSMARTASETPPSVPPLALAGRAVTISPDPEDVCPSVAAAKPFDRRDTEPRTAEAGPDRPTAGAPHPRARTLAALRRRRRRPPAAAGEHPSNLLLTPPAANPTCC